MRFRRQNNYSDRRASWHGTALGRRTPNLLDQRDFTKPTPSKPLWTIGLLVFVLFGAAAYGGLQWAQENYFEGSRVLGEATSNQESRIKNQELGIENVKNVLGIAALGIKAAPYVDFFNQLLGGKDSVKTYLLVFQNYSEMRPTGGFMGSYAWVRIVGGRQISYGIPGGGFYDLTGSRSVLVEAPKPFQIFSPMEQIWNSNWYPDFPTSAKRIGWFYVNSGQDSVDGIIAVTPKLLEQLLGVTGPIELPEYNKVISAENAYRELQTHVEFEYDKEKNQPKEIISVLTPKLLERLMELPHTEYSRLLGTIAGLLRKKHILAFVSDEQAQGFVQSRGWDGRMLQYADERGSDYLSVVHTNIGGGKTDVVVRTTEDVQKALLSDGTLRTTVVITRTHQGDPSDPLFGLTNIDYVRVYAPKGATYVSSEGFGELPKELYKEVEWQSGSDAGPETIERDAVVIERDHTRVVTEMFGPLGMVPERIYTSFGNWMIVKPGEVVVARLTFDVPGFIPESALSRSALRNALDMLSFQRSQPVYSLIWQKQPGLDAVDQRLTFFVPSGLEPFVSGVNPSHVSPRELIWNTTSDQDHVFVVGLK